MINPNCKIGKVKPKLTVVQPPVRTHLYEVLEWAGRNIDENTHAVVVGIMRKDRTVVPGVSYVAGYAPADLFGCCDALKHQLTDMVWPGHDQR